jgi:hypothetical protein
MPLSTGKTNDTPTIGDHAAHHNAIANVVNALGLAFIARQTTTQAVGTTGNKLACQTVDEFTLVGGSWNGDTLTIGVNGLFVISYDVCLVASGGTGTFETYIVAAGQHGGGQRTEVGDSPFPKHTGTMTRRLTVNQTVYVQLDNFTGANRLTELFIPPRLTVVRVA